MTSEIKKEHWRGNPNGGERAFRGSARGEFWEQKKKRRSEEKDKEKGGQMLVDETVNIA